jgi:CheY-like chemotaxis protein
MPARSDLTQVLSAGADGARRPVLLAEDNPVNHLVAWGRLGCDAAPDHLVPIDWMLPGLDGYETTAEIRQIEPAGGRTPVVAMTANATQGSRERCLTAGMDGYLSKWVDREALAQVGRAWTEGAPP